MPTAAFTFQGFYRAFCLMLGCGILLQGAAFASGLLNLAEIIAHPDQYDRQEVVVSGQVTNVQLATNRQGQPAYGFLLKDSSGTVKVIGLGQVEVKEGDQVIVEGVFSRLRQAGRTIIYNEIKALSVKSLNRLNPDLVG
jgi:hypothetical protein